MREERIEGGIISTADAGRLDEAPLEVLVEVPVAEELVEGLFSTMGCRTLGSKDLNGALDDGAVELAAVPSLSS